MNTLTLGKAYELELLTWVTVLLHTFPSVLFNSLAERFELVNWYA